MKQMVDRENSIAFPNENAETMIRLGLKMWKVEVDPGCLMQVRRDIFDKVLINHGIVSN